jgi:hypothetical protein
MDEPYEIIGGKKVFTGPVELTGRQTAHIADAKVDYTTPDLDTEAEIIAAFNATNGKINAILAVLEKLGPVASA